MLFKSSSLFRFTALLCLMSGSFMLSSGAQENPENENAPNSLPSTKTLPANYPVIRLNAGCAGAATSKAHGSCSTVITREEFEELVNAINPRMDKRERHELAENYGKMLALSQVAMSEHLDKTPGVAALLRYTRTGALGGAAYKRLLKQTSEISDGDIEKYYATNKGDFERFNFERIYVPLEGRRAPIPINDVAKEEKDPPTPDMKPVADTMRARAAGGEDFKKLQKEVVTTVGLQGDPAVDMQEVMRASLPEEHNKAFELAPGAVSSVIKDASGYYIYKLVSKQVPPLVDIRPQVLLRLQTGRMAAALKKVEDRSIVNEQYFDKYEPPAPDPNQPEVDDD